MCQNMRGRDPRGSYTYLVIGAIVTCISLGLLLALFFSQGFIYWYFVFGLVIGVATLFYGFVWFLVSRRAWQRRNDQVDAVVVDPVVAAELAGMNGTSLQHSMYAGRSAPEKITVAGTTEIPDIYARSPHASGAPPPVTSQQMHSLPGFASAQPVYNRSYSSVEPSAPPYEAPQFQQGPSTINSNSSNNKEGNMDEAALTLAVAAPPLEYGSPPPKVASSNDLE